MWQVGSLIQLYTKKPTVSQVSFLLPEQGLIFPAVTICSYNPIKKNYIEGVNKTGSFSRRLLDYLNLAFMEVQFLLSINNPQELELANQEYEYYSTRTNPQFSLGGFFWNASLSCTEMLKICSFGGREFDCCQYARGILTDIGKCYQLDLAQTDELWLKQQIQAGVNNGLQIIADFHTEQQIGVFDMDAGPPLANEFETGFRYYVHGSKAGVHLSTEGISVSPGTKVYSAISPTTYILLPTEKWGNCTPKWPTEYAAPTETDEAYSSMKCKTLCRANYFNELCGCSPFIFNVEGSFRVCAPYEIYECLNNTILSGSVENPEDIYQVLPTCTACKIECQRTVYHTFNSYAQGFSRGSLAWLRRKNSEWTPGHVRSNFVAINIFYRDMIETQYKQIQSISLTEILSDIGGNMGLFMGMSLISLTELFIFLAKISWIFISKQRREHMLAKKREDEEREKRLQDSLEMAANRNLRSPSSPQIEIDESETALGFTTRFRKFAGSIRKKAQIWPTTQYYNDPPDVGLKVPDWQDSSRRASTTSTKSLDLESMISTGKKHHVDFVDTVLRSKLFGEEGRAVDNYSSSDEDAEELLELKIDLDAFKRTESGTKMVQQCTIQNPNKTAQRRRTNSIAVLMIDSPPSNRTDFTTKRQRALSQVDEDIKRKKERNLIVPSLLMKNLRPMVSAQAQFATNADSEVDRSSRGNATKIGRSHSSISGTRRFSLFGLKKQDSITKDWQDLGKIPTSSSIKEEIVEPKSPKSILKEERLSRYSRKAVTPSMLMKNLGPMIGPKHRLLLLSLNLKLKPTLKKSTMLSPEDESLKRDA
uniref:Uncharacterized protein n=1 Tax=Ditylenchus dipsaci TaxID=166011 RepID=A0A915ERR9_9BILA